jgi:CheY-like chemotaxis protein
LPAVLRSRNNGFIFWTFYCLYGIAFALSALAKRFFWILKFSRFRRKLMANILLVEDNGSVLLTLAIALRRHGHTVTIATGGLTALDELRAHAFDALVSDVRMPGLTGVELAECARTLQPSLRIVLTSAYPNIEATNGVEAFLRKPIDIEQLHALLDGPREDKPLSPPTPQKQPKAKNPLSHFRALRV